MHLSIFVYLIYVYICICVAAFHRFSTKESSYDQKHPNFVNCTCTLTCMQAFNACNVMQCKCNAMQ